MKTIAKLLVVAAAVAGVALAGIADDFEAWARKYGKTYATAEEREQRLRVFEENVRLIARKNAESAGERYAVNAFADMTEAELQRRFTSRALQKGMRTLGMPSVRARPADAARLPKQFDWVEKGAVSPVKNQKSCGSCWAFGAVGTMEGQWFLRTGKLAEFSEQNLVDCDHECMVFPGTTEESCDDGCDGGMEPNAFQYVIKNNGIMLRSDYPYTGRVGKCKFDPARVVGHFTNWTFVTVDHEDDLRQYLYDHGPVSVGVHADEWFYYSGGVFNSTCQTENDHAVLLTGWGEDANGTPYWIIKNSWDTTWGIDGYIHLYRGNNKCGILEMMSQIHP